MPRHQANLAVADQLVGSLGVRCSVRARLHSGDSRLQVAVTGGDATQHGASSDCDPSPALLHSDADKNRSKNSRIAFVPDITAFRIAQ